MQKPIRYENREKKSVGHLLCLKRKVYGIDDINILLIEDSKYARLKGRHENKASREFRLPLFRTTSRGSMGLKHPKEIYKKRAAYTLTRKAEVCW